jgi:hypothetical protein
MVLGGIAEVGLLHHEGHSQYALPEIDGALLRRSDDGYVVHSLDLNFLHDRLLSSSTVNLANQPHVGLIVSEKALTSPVTVFVFPRYRQGSMFKVLN